MKNLIFVLVLMAGAFGAEAQMVGGTDLRTLEKEYCTVTFVQGFGAKMQMGVDWGQEGKDFVLKDEEGKKIKVVRYVMVLNMMSEWGWEFVQMTGSELNTKLQNWLFRRVAEK